MSKEQEGKHTLGPWKVVAAWNKLYVIEEKDNPSFFYTKACPVAIISKKIEQKSNAKLIAKAPEMYEEIQQLKSLLNQKTSIIEALRERTKLQEQKIGVLAKRIEELARVIVEAYQASIYGDMHGNVELSKQALGES